MLKLLDKGCIFQENRIPQVEANPHKKFDMQCLSVHLKSTSAELTRARRESTTISRFILTKTLTISDWENNYTYSVKLPHVKTLMLLQASKGYHHHDEVPQARLNGVDMISHACRYVSAENKENVPTASWCVMGFAPQGVTEICATYRQKCLC